MKFFMLSTLLFSSLAQATTTYELPLRKEGKVVGASGPEFARYLGERCHFRISDSYGGLTATLYGRDFGPPELKIATSNADLQRGEATGKSKRLVEGLPIAKTFNNSVAWELDRKRASFTRTAYFGFQYDVVICEFND